MRNIFPSTQYFCAVSPLTVMIRLHCTQLSFARKLLQHTKTKCSTNFSFYMQLSMGTLSADREQYLIFHLTLPKYQTIPDNTQFEFCLHWKNPPVLTLYLSRVDFLSDAWFHIHSYTHSHQGVAHYSHSDSTGAIWRVKHFYNGPITTSCMVFTSWILPM